MGTAVGVAVAAAVACVVALGGCGSGGAAGPNGRDGGGGAGRPDGSEDGGTGADAALAPERAERLAPPAGYGDEGIQVAPDGDDATGDGTAARPYRHVQYVLDNVAQPGDTVLLRGGTYDEEVRIRAPRITIRSHPDEWAVIRQPAILDEADPPLAVWFDVDAHGGRLQRLEVVGGFYGVKLESTWDWGDPADRSGVTGITIEDCRIHDSGRDAVKVTPESDGLTIRRTEIWNTGVGYPPGTPADEKNAEGIDVVNADDVLVQDSYVHDTASSCIYLKGGARRGVVERTRAERCGALGIVLGFDTSPEFFDLAENPDWYENLDGIVRNCVVRDTRYAGIAAYAALRPVFLHNTVIDTAHDGQSPLYFGLTYQDWDPAAGRPPTVAPVVRQNVFYQPAGRDAPCASVRWAADLDGMAALAGPADLEGNLYFRQDGPCTFDDARPDARLEAGDLAAWRAHVAGEARSLEADPGLEADGHLAADSPCVDAGEPLSLVSYDIDGDPRQGAPDLGADERGE